MKNINIEYVDWLVNFLSTVSNNFRDYDILCGLEYTNASELDNQNIINVNIFFNQIKSLANELNVKVCKTIKNYNFCDYYVYEYIIKYNNIYFRIGNTSQVTYDGKHKKLFKLCNFCEKLNNIDICDIDLNEVLAKKSSKQKRLEK